MGAVLAPFLMEGSTHFPTRKGKEGSENICLGLKTMQRSQWALVVYWEWAYSLEPNSP